MSALTKAVAQAADAIPELVRAAVVLLPEGAVLASIGEGDYLDFEQMGRACRRCFADDVDAAPPFDAPVSEYVMVTGDGTLVLQRSEAEPRVALAAVCARATNLAWVLHATRQAVTGVAGVVERELYATVDAEANG